MSLYTPSKHTAGVGLTSTHFNLGPSWRRVFNIMPGQLYSLLKTPVPIEWEAEGAPKAFWSFYRRVDPLSLTEFDPRIVQLAA